MEPRISILVPTRKRCGRLKELYYSAMETANKPGNVEFVVYVDDDDNSYDGVDLYNMKIIRGPQITISEAWNKCADNASGDYLGLFGDDVIFRDKDWDRAVLERFDEVDDKIGFVYGYDGSPYNDTYGTHGFVHKNWVEVVGYFVPPYFAANYVDLWINDLAKGVQRHMYIPYYFEHMHQGFGKAADDEVYQEGRERDKGMQDVYKSKLKEREEQIQRLKQFIDDFKEKNNG